MQCSITLNKFILQELYLLQRTAADYRHLNKLHDGIYLFIYKIHVVLIVYSLQEMQIEILSIALTILFISFISVESYHSPLPFMVKPTLVNSNAVVSQD